ncbi:MAG: hypothetical protein ABUK01_14475 [Leptospirales bacterium]
MDSQTEEIRDSLFGGNFQTAFDISKQWLDNLALDQRNTPEYLRAQEAFIYSRYFLHRQERILRVPSGEARARLFLEFLYGLGEIRKENKYDKHGDPLFWETISSFIHAQVAEGFAKAFAGQKSYNLDDKEVIQLSVSLLKVGKWRQSLEALTFMHRYNPYNPEVHLLMSFAQYNLKDETLFLFHFREALFLKPELLGDYQEFVPVEIFRKLENINTGEDDDIYKYRNYALLLEINGFYKAPRPIIDKELTRIEADFLPEYEQFNKNREFFHNLLPRLLLSLCWLIHAYKQRDDYDKTEFFRNIMQEISPDTWDTFFEKGL